MNIGYSLIRDESTEEDKRAFIDWCNEHGCTYKSENGVWTILPPDDSERRRIQAEAEIATLKDYLDSTDYMVIKCLERGLSMESEYPNEYVERQNARRRINELEATI